MDDVAGKVDGIAGRWSEKNGIGVKWMVQLLWSGMYLCVYVCIYAHRQTFIQSVCLYSHIHVRECMLHLQRFVRINQYRSMCVHMSIYIWICIHMYYTHTCPYAYVRTSCIQIWMWWWIHGHTTWFQRQRLRKRGVAGEDVTDESVVNDECNPPEYFSFSEFLLTRVKSN